MCIFYIPSRELLCIDVSCGTSLAMETINRMKNNTTIISIIVINEYIPEIKFQKNVQLTRKV
jgi:hypothetical protein